MTKPSLEVMRADGTSYGSTDNRGNDDVAGETSPLVYSINDSSISQADAETPTHPSDSKSRRWIAIAATFLVAFAFMGLMSSRLVAENKTEATTALVGDQFAYNSTVIDCTPTSLTSSVGCTGKETYRKCSQINTCIANVESDLKACTTKDHCGCANDDQCGGCPGGSGYEHGANFYRCN
mmetsp:Transcript_18639/g.25863  ORF Transcript_18639/g.25863 Transcript_18639/m.25863 type:complete len:180 (+) Transcript_18639:116-655(+)